MDFSFEKIDDGLFLVNKHYTTQKAAHGSDITGPYWMLIKTTVIKGSLWWNSDGERVYPAKEHYIFVPPYSWAMEQYTKGTELKIQGLISKIPIPGNKILRPVIINSSAKLPKNLKEVSQLVNLGEEAFEISTCTSPSSLSARAKDMIDNGYRSSIEINEIAKKLKTSPAVLSRKFKSDFGKTPAFYRQGLKVTVGMYELMMGTSPAEAAVLAGYQDLGRFYKQFKGYLKQTPSEYSEKSKNAKTHKKK